MPVDYLVEVTASLLPDPKTVNARDGISSKALQFNAVGTAAAKLRRETPV